MSADAAAAAAAAPEANASPSSSSSSSSTTTSSSSSSSTSTATATSKLKPLSKPRLPQDGSPVPSGSRILYHCGTKGCRTRTSLHLLAFSCKLMKPLCSSPSCVKYELKTFYCPQTLLPSTDAAQDAKKNRSATAFSCPECFTALGVQKGFALPAGPTGQFASTEEADGSGLAVDGDASSAGSGAGGRSDDFYFACPFCGWTSLPHLHDVSPKMLVDSATDAEKDERLEEHLQSAIERTSEDHEQWARGAAVRMAAGSGNGGGGGGGPGVNAGGGPGAAGGRGSGGKETRAIIARIRSLTNVRNTPPSGKVSPRRSTGSVTGSRSNKSNRRRRKDMTWQDVDDELLAQTDARPHQELPLPLLEVDARPLEVPAGEKDLPPFDSYASSQQTLEHCVDHYGAGDAAVGQPVSKLRPLRVPLRVKRSVRCKESLTILIHPNVNPQQGDSNFGRNQSARWFEMDEFASEYIPRMVLHRVTAQDVTSVDENDEENKSVVVECVVEVRKPRAMVKEEDKLTLKIAVRPDGVAASSLAGVAFDIPPAPLILTKSSGTTKDQTAATTDPKNTDYVISSADGAVLLRLKAIAPTSGPVTYPLTMHVQYPVKYKGQDTFDFSYNVDIDTVAP